MPTLIADVLRDLRVQRDLSRSQLSWLTVRQGKQAVGEKTIQALETAAGRVPEADIIEALAQALEVEPAAFYEYPIAVARRAARAKTRPTPGEDQKTLDLVHAPRQQTRSAKGE